MRFTCGFAALLTLALAGSSIAQGDFAPESCPGGMNLELTALTVPQAAVVPVPPAPPPKKQQPKPRPEKKKKLVPSRPAPPPEPEEEAPPPPPVQPRPSRTDAALDDMIGSFGSRPRSGPNIDYSAPLTPNQGIGDALRQDAAIRDHFGRRHRDRERRPRDRTPRQPTPAQTQSTPQSVPVPHTEPCPGMDSSTPLDIR